jgi:glycosyltransferase involved in cell wall biosynthesis
MQNSRKARIALVYGYPGANAICRQLISTVGGQLLPAYSSFESSYAASSSRLRRYAPLVRYAYQFPQRPDWDLILGDGPQPLPILMKQLHLLHPTQKIVPYLAGEFNYFLAKDYYGGTKTKFLRALFQTWDSYLGVGEMTAGLVRQVVPPRRHGDIFTFPNFLMETRRQELANVSADLTGTRMLFIGGGEAGFRTYYKGLDILHQAHALALQQLPSLECTIAGRWNPTTQKQLGAEFPALNGRVHWIGHQSDLAPVLGTHGLYIHCARGEAWGLTILEAMFAGIPPIVSEWTGAKEAVYKIDPRLVVPLDPQVIAERVLWYFGLSLQERAALGQRAREVVLADYSEVQGIATFRTRVRELLDHLGMAHLSLPAWNPQ